MTSTAATDIAVIGLAGRFPGARDIAQFWRNLRGGVESISFFTDEELRAAGVGDELLDDPRFVKAWGAVDGADLFDAHFFGYSAREATVLDPQHRLFLECAWTALEDAGHRPGGSAGSIGVYAGSSLSSYLLANLLPGRGLDSSPDGLELLIANDKDYLANRVSYKLDLDGPAVCVQSACSTSLVAVHLACQGLLNFECDVALAGGSTVRFPQTRGYLYQEGMILSPDGHCRPFDARAAGTVAGSGAGVVVLRRLDDALADGDRVDAVIRATAINNDGATKVGYTAPSVEGQARVIAAALGLADVEPASIRAIEAHGTGTQLGDPIEIAALTRVFAKHTAKREHCAISSVKSNIGHLDSAAGVAALIKAVLQVKHGELVPSVNFSELNPEIDFSGTPFYVNTELKPWKANGDPRRIGVSSFGFGGTNAHAVLEEPPARDPAGSRRDHQVLLLSAKTAAALDVATTDLAAALRHQDAVELADVAFTTQAGRQHFPHRRAVVVRSGRDAAGALDGPLPRHVATGEPAVAWLFPGQGSQYVGMGRGLYRTEPVYRGHVDTCAELLRAELGLDLRDLLLAEPGGSAPAGGPVNGHSAAGLRLAQTAIAQPALFTVEHALARLLQSWGLLPAATIGHSVGELTAACLAGVFEVADAVRLVAARGRLMQAQPSGAMLSVALSEADLGALLPATLSLAAVNAPELCVVAGTEAEVEAFAERLAGTDVPHRLLHTSHAFHSAMMDPVVDAFAAEVARVSPQPPVQPYVSSRTGDWVTAAEATDPAYWAGHLRDTVRFGAGVRRLLERDITVLVEVGPGSVLATLARLAPGARGAVAVPTMPAAADAATGSGVDNGSGVGSGSDAGSGSDVATVQAAVGRLWSAGADVDWPALHRGERRGRVALPTYPFERRRYFVDPPGPARPTASPLAGLPVGADPPVDEPRPDTGIVLSTVEARPSLLTEYVAPTDRTQERVVSIWEDLLGVAPVGVLDSFVELGGHSLLATKVVSRLREEFGVDVPLRRLVRASTVTALAELVAELGGTAPNRPGSAEATPDGSTEVPMAVPDWEHLHEPFPLSEIQQAQWIGRLGNFSLGNVGAHMYWEVDRSDVDLDRLNQAWNRVMARHAMLRAVFTSDGYQRILPDVHTYEFPVVDLRDAPPETVDAELAALRERMSHEMRPEDEWPLFEIRAVLLPGGRTRLFLSFELMMADMGSVRILLRDWRSYHERPEVELAPLGISFRDYRAAAVRMRDTALYRRSVDYWRERVRELPPAPDLPLAVAPEQVTSPKFVPHEATIPTVTWQRLRRRAARHGVTPSAVLLAAYACTLGAWSASGRFTLNVTTNIRLPVHPDADQLVGGFASFTLLPVDLVADDSVLEVSRRLQEQNWQDLEHRYVNGVDVLRELARQRGGPNGAMMPAVFTSTLVNESEDNESSMVDWLGELAHQVIQTPQVWIDAAALEVSSGLVVGWPAVEELFPTGLVGTMFDAYVGLLHRLGEDENAWESSPKLLPAVEGELVERANATGAVVPDGLLCDPLLAAAERRPGAVAVVAAGRQLLFGDLARRAYGLAWRLRGLGVGPGHLVVVGVDKSVEQVVAALGVLLAGAAYVPVDPELPTTRADFLVGHAQARVVVVRAGGPGADRTWPVGVRVVAVDLADDSQVADRAPERVTTPADPAYVVYTSGSTGVPKGVVVSHRAALNTCVDVNARYGVGESDAVLGLSALSFDLSVWDIFGVLGAGGTLVLPEPDARRDPGRWLELVNAHGVTLWNSVPALMAMFVEHIQATSGATGPSGATGQTATGAVAAPVPTLRRVLLSGDWVPVELPDRIRAAAPAAEVISLGGATEAAIWSIAYPIGAVDPAWESVPYGLPLANQQFHVLNDRWQPCPVGVLGELFIGGVGLADGYWREPEKTAAAFVTHPVTGERLYRTGDLGRRLPDGLLEFCGRADDQVKVGGFRIELGEIEHVLNAHPRVVRAVAAAVGDRHHRRLAGYLVPVPGEALDPEAEAALVAELKAWAETRLPHYMIPTTFTVLDALPLSANGKVDRKALPDPAAVVTVDSADPVEPSPLAVRLADVAARALGVERVDPRANFFELGGDSITGVRIISQINDEGIELRLQDLFEAQSIVELADRLAARGVVAEPAGGAARALPLTGLQRRLFAGCHPERPSGVQRVDIPAGTDLDPVAVGEAMGQIVARHGALRTRFVAAEGGWAQRVADRHDGDAYVPVIELGALPVGVRAEAMAEMVAEMRGELDVSSGPVFAVALFDLGTEGRVLTWLVHELVVDTASWEVLLADLFGVVGQLRHGESVVLPPPTDPFTRWLERLGDTPEPDPGPPPNGPPPNGPPDPGAVTNGRTTANGSPATNPEGEAALAVSTVDSAGLLDAAWTGHRMSLADVALAALLDALRGTGAGGSIDVLRDLRADTGLDVSRTVGNFAALGAVPAELAAHADLAELLPAVKDWGRAMPVPASRPADVVLHCLGRFGERTRLDRILPGPAGELPGGPAVPTPVWQTGSLGQPVRVSVVERGGALRAEFRGARPGVSTPDLATAFGAALDRIAEHCRAPGASHVTAGDFPLADLGDDDLATVLGDLTEEL